MDTRVTKGPRIDLTDVNPRDGMLYRKFVDRITSRQPHDVMVTLLLRLATLGLTS